MAQETTAGGGAALSQAAPPCPNGQLYTVRAGDSMFEIARRFNVPLNTLIAANPQVSNPNLILPGQILCVPVPAAPPVSCPGGFIYTVQPGDTLFNIARRFGLSLEALRAANPQIVNPDLIFPGQNICVPAAPPVTCPGGTLYTVRPGDTMFDIATRFGLSLQTLIAANPQIPDPSMIFPGQSICLPGVAAPVPPAPVVISPVVSPPKPERPMPPMMPVTPPQAEQPAVSPPIAPAPPVISPGMAPPVTCPIPPMAAPRPMPCPSVQCPLMIEPIECRPRRKHRKHRKHRRDRYDCCV
ncbi:MAG: LysM peptidoglycan-binding domain-containing protein [Bacteroidota bacterium]